MNLVYTSNNEIISTTLYRENMGADAYLYLPGPSLANIKQQIGPGIFSFAVNTAYPKVRPDVWIGMDTPDCYDPDLPFESFMKIFRNGLQGERVSGKPLSGCPMTYFATVQEPENDIASLFNTHRSLQAFAWFKHTLGVALHVILQMGAKNIFLVGCDMGGDKDYWDDRELDEKLRKKNRRLYEQQVNFMHKFSRLATQHHVNIISCTPDSPINRFLTYIPYEDAVKQSQSIATKKKEQYRHVIDVRKDRLVKQAEKIKWNEKVDSAYGVIVGVDKNQSWMLPWWYKNFRKHNGYPILFVDFGMDAATVEWCKSKGYYTKMPKIDVGGWFKKPLACKLTLFKYTVWMDVDCQVQGNIAMVFRYAKAGFAVAEDIRHKFTKAKIPLNTGVVAFKHKDKTLSKWADDIVPNEPFFRSDQEILENMLDKGDADFLLLPNRLHKPRMMKGVDNALILHWTGEAGKQVIKKQLEVHDTQSN